MATPKKKAAAKKVPAPAPKKSASKKVPTKQPAKQAANSGTRPAAEKKVVEKKAAKPEVQPVNEEKDLKVKEAIDNGKPEEQIKALARKNRHTPSIFKLPRKAPPVVFTLEDVREVLKTRREEQQEEQRKQEAAARKAVRAIQETDQPAAPKVLGAATLADILGFNPAAKQAAAATRSEEDVPQELRKYYRLLIDLRNHVKEGLNDHSSLTLKRSPKDDSGDISSFSSHLADNGTDAFDRDFALSLVANEQEALAEIEAAIQRIFNGTYGICEITGKPISHERLEAVPFTRYSLEGQAEFEKANKRRIQRSNAFIESADDVASFGLEDGDE